MAYVFSRNERVYLQKQANFNQIPHSSGVATLSGADACRIIRATLKQETSVLVRRDKTGSRSATRGVKGRQAGAWSIEASLVSTGAAGVVPDMDALFEALFGQAAVIATGVSATYSFSDLIKFFTMYSFRGDGSATFDQRAAYGCVVSTAQFRLGADIAEFTASGSARTVLHSAGFAQASTAERGGLTTFPAEPGTPVTAGEIIAGFTGQATLGGAVIPDIISATITISPANELVTNTFGSYLPTGAEGDERNITVEFSVYDNDGSDLEALKEAGRDKEPVDVNLQLGTEAGNIFEFPINNVQLASHDLDDSQRRNVVNFSASRAYATSLTSRDEAKMIVR